MSASGNRSEEDPSLSLSLRAAGSILSPTALIIPSRLWNEMNQNQFNAMYPPYCLLIELRIGISDATNLTALVGWTKPSSGPFINNSAILFFPFLFFPFHSGIIGLLVATRN